MPEIVLAIDNRIDLNEMSESFVDRLEDIEWSLNLTDLNDIISDDVRWAYFKIVSQWRQDHWDNTELQKQYEIMLWSYEELFQRSYQTPIEYVQATKWLLQELWDLRTKDWRRLVDTTINWWLYEAWIALYDWMEKAFEKVVHELEETIKILINPSEWEQVVSALWNMVIHPIDTLKALKEWLWEEFWDIMRDIQIVNNNSSSTWFAVEMWKFVPETAVPMIMWMVWPWKFLRILKLDKFIPDFVVKKLDWKSWKKERKESEDVRKVDILDFNFGFRNLDKKVWEASKDVERLRYYMDVEYLIGKKGRFEKVLETIDELLYYINNKALQLWEHQDFVDNYRLLRKNMLKLSDNPKLKWPRSDILKDLFDWEMKDSLIKLKPSLWPTE